ncbi:FkbM family methyltransferase [Erwinia oleae]|uniref:FkbM family methyltransferase n=1 Tax=Erwinia oleae TaxID=796334 RepID=UPI00068D76B9|nr:FkbM family methyltransferase [Erwinia oleae]
MKFISYSQNFEDVMLWRALNHIKKGFFIDVGAAWPDKDSVTKVFYDSGWNGINIEPNPSLYEEYKLKRERDLNLPYAISDYSGTESMSFIPNTGLSTLSNDVVAMHAVQGYESFEKEVEIKTLNQIYENYVKPEQQIHFLKIDVEGLEFNVLNGCDWKKCRPWIVVVESTIPMTQKENYELWEYLLTDSNYHFAYRDGLNRYYVADEHKELINKFKNPPNVFDGFILYSEQKKKDELSEVKKKIKRHLATERQLRKQVADKEHEAWLARHQLESIYLSRYWKLTTPVRYFFLYGRKLFNFIKYFDKEKSPRALVNFIFIRLERHPSISNKLKKILKKVGLHNFASKALHKSISPPTHYQLDSLSNGAKKIYKRFKAFNDINKD